MKIAAAIFLLSLGAIVPARAQDFLDRLDDRLTLSAFGGQVRTRFSGTLDLEVYAYNLPAPGLIDADENALFSPRLTLFVDSQIGPALYFFAQVRVDRHFDPTDEGAQIRLDEYALRFTPWEDGRFNLQVGKFAAVVGNWIPRHLSWDNPFITAPVVYENATALSDMERPYENFDGHLHDEKFEYLSEIWGPSYASGLSLSGRLGKFEYAAEIKNANLSSRPESWDATRVDFSSPTINARLGFRPDEAWNFGVSFSNGAYFLQETPLPAGTSRGDYQETVIIQDASYAWHHFQFWAEFHEARFEIPRFGDANTFGYFLETKYKFTPQLFGALRWNQQYFDDLMVDGRPVHWSADVWRLDAALTYRFTPHVQLKAQYNFGANESGRDGLGHLFAGQLTIRF